MFFYIIPFDPYYILYYRHYPIYRYIIMFEYIIPHYPVLSNTILSYPVS